MTEPRTLDEKGNATGPGPGEDRVGGGLDTRTEQEKAQPMTFGQKFVGVDFNPAGDDKVKKLKQLAAQMIDIVNEHDSPLKNGAPESEYINSSFKGGAMRRILDAQMWAVKHVTNRH